MIFGFSRSRISLIGNLTIINSLLFSSFFIYAENSQILMNFLNIDFPSQNSFLSGFILCWDYSNLTIYNTSIIIGQNTMQNLLKMEESICVLNEVSIFQSGNAEKSNFIGLYHSKATILNSINIMNGIYSELSYLFIYQSIISDEQTVTAQFLNSEVYLFGNNMTHCNDLNLLMRNMKYVSIYNSSFSGVVESFLLKIENSKHIFINKSTFTNNNNSNNNGFLLEITNSHNFFLLNSSFSNNIGFSSVYFIFSIDYLYKAS